MAITKIRGEQIADAVLKNAHIAPDAAISESKLALNFPTHAIDDTTALENRKVSDYVQVNATTVAGLGEVDLTTAGIIANTVPAIAAGDNITEGVFDKAHINSKVILRDTVTGNPVLAVNNTEVYGRTEFVPSPDEGVTPDKWTVKFYYMDGETETAYTFAAEANTIDWQYLQRFNLYTVSELFAANEKFVAGAADATAHLNILQLARDIYTSVALDRDGNANLGTPLQTQIADHIADAEGAHVATAISFTSAVTGLTAATDVKAAIEAALLKAQNDASEALTAHLTAEGDHAAAVIAFDNTYAAFTPVNGAQAVDNVQAALEALKDAVNGGGSALDDHLNDTVDAHDATAISFINTTAALTHVDGTSPVDTVQAAIEALDKALDTANATASDLQDELDTTQAGAGLDADGFYIVKADANYIQTATNLKNADELLDAALKGVDDRVTEAEDDIAQLYAKTGVVEDGSNAFASNVYVATADTLIAAIGKLDAALDEHNTRATAAHAASAISFDPATTNFDPATVNVQAALVEIDADLAAHIADTTDAHMATAIGYSLAGWDGITTVAQALDDLKSVRHDHFYYEMVATGGETTVTITEGYDIADNISVYLNGQLQRAGLANAYVKTDTNTITFNDALFAGDFVAIEWKK